MVNFVDPQERIVVAHSYLADVATPLQLWSLLRTQGEHAALFESCEGGEKWGRFTIIAASPLRRFHGSNGSWVVRAGENATILPRETDPLDWLQQALRYTTIDIQHELDIPGGGFYGVFGYEIMRYIEPTVDVHLDKGRPVATIDLFEPSVLYVWDNISNHLHIVDVIDPTQGEFASQVDSRVRSHLQLFDAQATSNSMRVMMPDIEADIEVVTQPSSAEYQASVIAAQKAITAGECIQVVLAQQFDVEVSVDALDLYRMLRVINPSPYLFLLPIQGATLIGSSPEVMVRLRDGRIELRPIAGTRARGGHPAEDEALERELLEDPKELAEHIMLIDLGRNDVGRVAEPGTVTVPDQFIVERYSHVMHIVSQVEGQLRDGADAVDLFRATFPAGTLSGAPKVRACQLIHELEHIARGTYSGAVGYFDYNGNMDTCIAIRTFEHQPSHVRATAGAGIVYDSIPENEDMECHNKARGLLRALQIVEGQS